MAVIIPNEAERNILTQLRVALNHSGGTVVRLFQGGGAVTIDADTTLATLDAAEADFSGYSPVARTDWTTVTTDGGGNAFTQCGSVNFQHDGGGTSNDIYGWYAEDGYGGLVCCEEFGAPVTMNDNSDIITILPKLFAREGP